MEAILTAKDLCKTFSNGSVQQHVLKNLNLTVEKGEFVVIMGNSGSGKSTLLYALSGMDRPTLGSISYRGEEISKYSNDKLAVFRRKHCGFVFQQNYLNDTMSILDNVMVSGFLSGRGRKELAEEAKELLLAVGLSESSFCKFPTQLSGGEQQRAAVVRGSLLDRSYVYQIFSGAKIPSRDKLIALAFGMHLTDDETQKLLKLSGNRELYARDERDALILFALQRKMTVMDTNSLLFEHHFAVLDTSKE